jgi:hypothetical protein
VWNRIRRPAKPREAEVILGPSLQPRATPWRSPMAGGPDMGQLILTRALTPQIGLAY